MAIETTVVQDDLAVHGHQFVAAVDDQRIDLGQIGVGVDVGVVQPSGDLGESSPMLLGQVNAFGQLIGLIAFEAQEGVHPHGDNLLRGLGGHLFDLHTALAAGHDHHPAGGSVQHRAQVDLLADVGCLVHQHLLDGQPLDVHAQNGLGNALGLFRGLGHLDATGLASSADQHLAFDHDRTAQILGDLAHIGCGVSHIALGDGNPVGSEDALRLIFLKFQMTPPLEQLGPAVDRE